MLNNVHVTKIINKMNGTVLTSCINLCVTSLNIVTESNLSMLTISGLL